MPELNFQLTGVEAFSQGLAPLLHFHLRITLPAETDSVQGLWLNVQIQLQCPQRSYSPLEQQRLSELFGPPEQWAQTLRNRLWAHSSTTVGPFTGAADAILSIPCSYDLNIAAAKYFYALEGGAVPLLFLFSGSLFYTTAEGRLQVERISWNRECTFSLPVSTWKELMEVHYGGTGWLSLRQDVFARLYAYKRCNGLPTWEETIELLLQGQSGQVPVAGARLEQIAAKEVAA